MLRSTAVVATASAHRAAEALLALLASAPSVRVETTHPSITCLVFPFGVAAVLPGLDGLVLIASATDATSLGLVEDVLGPVGGDPGAVGGGPRLAFRLRRRQGGAPGGRLRLS